MTQTIATPEGTIMKSALLRRARTVASIALCMILASACRSGGNTPDPIPVDAIVANATATLDTTNSVPNTGNASQSGALILVSASGTSTATFTADPALVAPGNTLTGNISNVSDGVGSRFSMSGSSTTGPSTTDGIFSDFRIDFRNPSDNQSVRVTLRAIVSNNVLASGADAFAFSSLSVRDDANVEIFFSEHRIDTNNPAIDLAADAENSVFSLVLPPGASTRVSALQSQRGGVSGRGEYRATLDAVVRIESVDVI